MPLKEGYEKTLQNYKDAKAVELNNQKQQYEYWMLEKDQALAKMLSGFNKYREKKSVQMRKCEQEIVTLFTYAEKLEVVVKMAEEGKFYTQQSQHNDTYDGGRGATMIIPSSLKPTRPGSDKTKTPQLALSQRIMKKTKEHDAHDEQIKNDAIEAMLLKHGGFNSASSKTNTREEFVETPEMTNQIRTLLSSPSVGRDLVSTANITPGSRQKEDKREKLFSRDSDSRRHTISSPTNNKKTPFRPRSGSTTVTVRAHHSSAAGPGPKAANSIRKSVSINDDNNDPSLCQPMELESSLFRNPENIKYVFNDDDEATNTSNLPLNNFDTMMVLPPAQTESISVVKTAQDLVACRSDVKRKVADIARLQTEVASLREQLEINEQVDIHQILASVEGNETLEYIRQLEGEQLALRSSVKDVSNQLQNSKVANAALARQFQTYKTQMKKRPSTGKIININNS